MGQDFKQETFTESDYTEFRKRLQQQVTELKKAVQQPDFSSQPASIGAELEVYLIDQQGLPSAKNMVLIEAMQHKQLVEELNQYNLEYNLSPVLAQGSPFTTMQNELTAALTRLQEHANAVDTRVVPIGILPTLKPIHLHKHFLTDLPRYRALTKQLVNPKGEPFTVDINGLDSLQMEVDEVTLEGANTSFQIHLRVSAERFSQMYNAAQLITPLVLALSGNSPTFLGNRLWHETRIALFKQSIDTRVESNKPWRQPARVSFGQGWIRQGAWEIFAENVALYRPLLPVVSENAAPFSELLMHHGTVWSWNRPVFEPGKNSHLRIEYRAFPAGPTVADMMANAAFAIGLTQALSNNIDDLIVKLPFHYAEHNFYRAAQDGLGANIIWPKEHQHHLAESNISDIIAQVLPLAAAGLAELNVDSAEINRMMTILENRLANRQTGSQWQLDRLARYRTQYDLDQSLNMMLNDYIDNMRAGEPVSTW